MKTKEQADAFHILIAIVITLVACWLGQGFYFILNDVDYGSIGIGLSFMMFFEVIALAVLTFFGMYFIEEHIGDD